MRRLLIAMGIGMAALEAVNAPMLGAFWFIAAAFGLMFAGLTWWLMRRDTRPPVVLLGLLFLVELVMLPGYERPGALDWTMQGITLVLSGLGLIAAVGSLFAKRRGGAPIRPSSSVTSPAQAE